MACGSERLPGKRVVVISFGEVLGITNAGFQARAGAEWRRQLRLSVDWTYGDVGDAIDIGLVKTDFNVQQHIVDARLGYNVHDTRAEHGWAGTVITAEAGSALCRF